MDETSWNEQFALYWLQGDFEWFGATFHPSAPRYPPAAIVLKRAVVFPSRQARPSLAEMTGATKEPHMVWVPLMSYRQL